MSEWTLAGPTPQMSTSQHLVLVGSVLEEEGLLTSPLGRLLMQTRSSQYHPAGEEAVVAAIQQ